MTLTLSKPSRVGQAIFVALATTCIVSSPRAFQAAPKPGRFDAIATVVNEAIARHELPGAVILVGRGDATLYHHAFGDRAVVPAPEPMSEDTIFDVASLSKVVATTPSVMQLVEQGKIRLADPISRFIPAFAQETTNAITVRQLLTHTSGFAPDLPLEVEFHGEDEAIRRAAAQPLEAKPDERLIYSDINFLVLGHIVSVVSGERLDRYARAHIFEPLGMTDTMFLPADALKARIAPTERCLPLAWPCSDPKAPFLRGTVHDPTARRMDGIAGHAGVFSTAADLAKYCRMLLNGGTLDGVRVLAPATVTRMTSAATPPAMGEARGLGWDIDTSLSSNRGDLFPVGTSYGHTGFTGTSLWIDPTSNSFVVFLSNRVHPDGKGDVTPLRGKVATIAAAAISESGGPDPRLPLNSPRRSSTGEKSAVPRARGPSRTSADPAFWSGDDPRRLSGDDPSRTSDDSSRSWRDPFRVAEPTLAGIDVLEAEGFARLKGKRVGLLTNQTGVTRTGVSTIDVLLNAPGVKLVALFSPEHGIRGELDSDVSSSRDAKSGLPIYSLYGANEASRHPTSAMLVGLDVLVVDLQDIGARFYTFPAAVAYVMQAAASQKLPVIVLDRPDPVNGESVEGPMQAPDVNRYVGFLPMPIRHGLTIGELVSLFNAEAKIGADVTVVRMKSWSRDRWFDETGLPWVNPSPNMRTLSAATVYPGIGAMEQTNVSVGRGTDTPFEQVGAPWIDGGALAAALNRRALDGIRFYPVTFTPAKGAKFGGMPCHGVFLVVTDRDRLRPVRVGVEIASALQKMDPTNFRLQDAATLFGSKGLVARIAAGEDPAAIAASWGADESRWRSTRQKYLLY